MAAAYGLYTHIQSNRRRSIALLIGLFFLVYVMVFAGALAAEAMSYDASLQWLLRKAWSDLSDGGAVRHRRHGAVDRDRLQIPPVADRHGDRRRATSRARRSRGSTICWKISASRAASRCRSSRSWRTPALNAFASGMNEKQYAVTVTTGLLDALDDAEIEAVLGHELTHIRNGDVRMLVIAVIIAGVISFFAEMFFRMFFYSRGWGRSSGDSDRGKGGAGIAIVIAIALIAVAWFLSVVIRFALSRKREFLADAGSVELTKNPDAMISALRKIENRGELRRRDLGRDGDVRRQSARGLRRTCSPPTRRSTRASTRWCASPAGTIRARSRCRNSTRRRAGRARASEERRRHRSSRCRTGLRAVEAAAASRSCRAVRRSSSAHAARHRRQRPIRSRHHGDRMADSR